MQSTRQGRIHLCHCLCQTAQHNAISYVSGQWVLIIIANLLHTHTHTRTHTHTHTFNGPFSGATQVSQYQKGKTNLDFIEARDSEWQWHQLEHMQVCTSLQTDNHASTPPLSFLQARCPSCRPTNSVRALKAQLTYYIIHINISYISRHKGHESFLSEISWWYQANTSSLCNSLVVVSALSSLPRFVTTGWVTCGL